MLTLARYRLLSFSENEAENTYVLDLERSGHVFEAKISRDAMPRDDIDVLLETGTPIAANIHDDRIMEYFIL